MLSLYIPESALSPLYYIPGGFDEYEHNLYRPTAATTAVATKNHLSYASEDRKIPESIHSCTCGGAEEDNYTLDCCRSFEDRHRQHAMNHGFHNNKKERKKKPKRNEKKKSNADISRDTAVDVLRYMDSAARQEFLFCMKALAGGPSSKHNLGQTPRNSVEKNMSNWGLDYLNNNDIASVHERFVTGRYCKKSESQSDSNNDIINESFLRNKEIMLYL